MEDFPCIRIKDYVLTGNCYGLLIAAKWLKDFALSQEKEQFILNQWQRIPYLSLKPGCKESDQWIFLEKFKKDIDEPYFRAGFNLSYNRKNLLLIKGNKCGLLMAVDQLERYVFTYTSTHICFGEDDADHSFHKPKNKPKTIFQIWASLSVSGGFHFNEKYNPTSRYSTARTERADRDEFQEELDGHLTHIIEYSNEKFFEYYLDEKNKFLKERVIKKYDYV